MLGFGNNLIQKSRSNGRVFQIMDRDSFTSPHNQNIQNTPSKNRQILLSFRQMKDEYQLINCLQCVKKTENEYFSNKIKHEANQSRNKYNEVKLSLKCGHFWEKSHKRLIISNKQIEYHQEYGFVRSPTQINNTNKQKLNKTKTNCQMNYPKRSLSLNTTHSNTLYDKLCHNGRSKINKDGPISHYIVLPLKSKKQSMCKHSQKKAEAKVNNIQESRKGFPAVSKNKRIIRSFSAYTFTRDLEAWVNLNSYLKENKVQTETAVSDEYALNQYQSQSPTNRERSISISLQKETNECRLTCLTEEALIEQVQYLRNLTSRLYQEKQIMTQKLKKFQRSQV